jgi:capsular exopolysaccharide synthesis family protein
VPAASPGAREIGPREGRHAREYLAVLHRRRWLVAGVALAVFGAALVRTLTTPPVYSATAQLLIGRSAPQVLEFKEVAQLDSQGWGDEYHLTQLKLLSSRSLARRAVDRLGLASDPAFAAEDGTPADVERVVDAFRARLKARRLESSQMFAVTVEAPRAELAAAAANAVAEGFIEESALIRSGASAQASAWLAAQLEEQRGKVRTAEDALEAFASETGLASFAERRLLVEQKLKQLGGRAVEVRARRIESEALHRHMSAAPDPQRLSAVIGNRVFQELRMELAQFERRETELLGGRHLEQHPEVVKVRAQIARARERMAAEAARVVSAAENDYRAALVQERELARELEAAQAEALDLHRHGLRYDALKRDLDAGQAVMASLLARAKQTDVAQDLRATPIRVVDRAAVPATPVRPRRRLDAALGLLAGLALGIAAALAADRLDPRLRTPADVRARLGAPVLAVVPETAAGAAPPAGAGADPGGAAAEAYRGLRAVLDGAWSDGAGRAIVVTSAASREGKTVSAVGLAQSMAARGDAVVLVDGDLRRPEAHALLRAGRAPGLVDVLGGGALEEALQPAGGTLLVLASGSAPASPPDALRPDAVRAILDALRSRYRWVVVDSAPLGAVSDALALAVAADATLLVVASEKTRADAARDAAARLSGAGARLLGVVLNRARVDRYPFDYGARSRRGSAAGAPVGGPELAAAE